MMVFWVKCKVSDQKPNKTKIQKREFCRQACAAAGWSGAKTNFTKTDTNTSFGRSGFSYPIKVFSFSSDTNAT